MKSCCVNTAFPPFCFEEGACLRAFNTGRDTVNIPRSRASCRVSERAVAMDGPDAPKGHPLASVRFVILVGGFVPKDPAVVGKPGSGGWWGGNQSRDAEVSRRKPGQ